MPGHVWVLLDERNRICMRAGIGEECPQAFGAGLDLKLICLEKDGLTGGHCRCCHVAFSFNQDDPRLVSCVECPDRARSKIDLFKQKMGTGDEGRSRLI